MAFADELSALKVRLKEARIPVDDVLARAGVNRSTWTRWNNRHSPQFSTWASVTDAAEALIRERQGRCDHPVAEALQA